MRLSRPNLSPAGKMLDFTFDGLTIPALAGESVAAALAANGISTLRASDTGTEKSRSDLNRGLYCGMGTCYECVVTIDGRANQRACMTKVQGGEKILSAPPKGSTGDSLAPLTQPPPEPTDTKGLVRHHLDILVIGAGPAGLSAALAARQAGATITILDERPQSGGQFYKPVASSHTVSSPPDRQFAAGAALLDEVEKSGVNIIQNSIVWGAFSANEIVALVDSTAQVFVPKRLILATGAFERAAPMPGWTLPGVMTTGAAQTLSRAYQVSPGKKLVIAGNGPLNFQLAADLVSRGVEVAAVVDSAPRPGPGKIAQLLKALWFDPANIATGLLYLAKLKRASVPIFWSTIAVEAMGEEHLTGVIIALCDGRGRPDLENPTIINADSLCLGYGLIASCEIARSLGCEMIFDPRHLGTLAVKTSNTGETSLPGVFAVGDGSKVAGASVALASGKIAGHAAATQLGLVNKADKKAERRSLSHARSFQAALWSLFKAPPPSFEHIDDDTILCRCENLDFGTLRAEINRGVASLGVLKRRTRLGMGRCQGRYCTPVAASLLSSMTGLERGVEEAFAPRLPVKPFPASALTIEKPEWGGHQRAGSPDLSRPLMREPFGDISADIVVIGGGVVGACVAYELAKSGHDVVVVERDDANLQASGANAGSLHVQLLSFDFGKKAEANGGPAAATLPLGPWAVSLWREHAETYAKGSNKTRDKGFEIRVTGGLMVAETNAGMKFLKEKAALERRHGVEAHIIDANDLRKLAPALSRSLIGAEYCPQEGKINPLTATYNILEMAKQHHARILPSANVTSLEQVENGKAGIKWLVSTNRGRIHAGRVVNAAGPWARKVGEMIGQDFPVYSAPLQMIVTERAPDLISQLIAHADRHLSLKQLQSGGLVIGGAWTARYNEAQRLNQTIRESIEGNLWAATKVLPQLAGLHVIRSWAGMNVNIDGAPIIGEVPGAPGFYNAVTSNGYTLAPAIARLTADIINQGKTDIDIRPFLIERF